MHPSESQFLFLLGLPVQLAGFSLLILLTDCHTFLFKLVHRIWCHIKQYHLVNDFLCSHHDHLSGWQCIDNVRRNYSLITPGIERVIVVEVGSLTPGWSKVPFIIIMLHLQMTRV